jgi:hypothetical protein
MGRPKDNFDTLLTKNVEGRPGSRNHQNRDFRNAKPELPVSAEVSARTNDRNRNIRFSQKQQGETKGPVLHTAKMMIGTEDTGGSARARTLDSDQIRPRCGGITDVPTLPTMGRILCTMDDVANAISSGLATQPQGSMDQSQINGGNSWKQVDWRSWFPETSSMPNRNFRFRCRQPAIQERNKNCAPRKPEVRVSL